ncbi:helix-turn-helix domain-containing protein [Curtobacterium aetherium]|uniref:Helix-turn-helix domain-containing protein n=1 Tax=Curtobacterium aetherium TaxID=2841594 RepID=A0ACD1E5W4_9MICO|nr:helix-turn-helix domain-containing protein [Curtobacterium sp. L6-1]QWS34042.1 helix-turn-helix domain-containing protein [Curtobacterium sp. L6-1]
MSFKAIEWAVKQETSPTQKAVLMMIAFHFNDAEHCSWPSHSLVATETNLGRSTVIRTVASLQGDLGLIEIEAREDPSGRKTSNRYYLPDYDPLSRPTSTAA